ncbi:MAG: GTP-binding protein [Deltaproteobacteria bacterium]|nr:GTP-binding protein [Deltaproteobacteria bacterium]MBW2306224.1 GTP-binding protein [Deltaproteobacteria bacterium]
MAITPLTLITGPLGSGKTTLLRRILESSSKKIAVLMNEFGELDIDSKVIEGKNVRITEMAGGCVCCSLIGEFEAAVREIIETVRPDLIVVETTGVAEPDALVIDIQDNLPEIHLDGIICIADADAMLRYPNIGHTARLQMETADIIVINKLDLIQPCHLEEIERKIRDINESAVFFHAVRCGLDTDLLFGADFERHVGLRAHLHESPMEVFAFRSNRALELEKFEAWTHSLPVEVYRAKGFLRCKKGSYLFNYVAGRWDLEDFPAEKTELVFIGENINRYREEIVQGLKQCEVQDAISLS